MRSSSIHSHRHLTTSDTRDSAIKTKYTLLNNLYNLFLIAFIVLRVFYCAWHHLEMRFANLYSRFFPSSSAPIPFAFCRIGKFGHRNFWFHSQHLSWENRRRLEPDNNVSFSFCVATWTIQFIQRYANQNILLPCYRRVCLLLRVHWKTAAARVTNYLDFIWTSRLRKLTAVQFSAGTCKSISYLPSSSEGSRASFTRSESNVCSLHNNKKLLLSNWSPTCHPASCEWL